MDPTGVLTSDLPAFLPFAPANLGSNSPVSHLTYAAVRHTVRLHHGVRTRVKKKLLIAAFIVAAISIAVSLASSPAAVWISALALYLRWGAILLLAAYAAARRDVYKRQVPNPHLYQTSRSNEKRARQGTSREWMNFRSPRHPVLGRNS